MAKKVNLDVSERLDITCRRGDSFSITLTLKDSSGTALPLATDNYSFVMQVRTGINASKAKGIPKPNPILPPKVKLPSPVAIPNLLNI